MALGMCYNIKVNEKENIMDYKKLQNGSDIRGVALEGIEGQSVNLTESVCKDIGKGYQAKRSFAISQRLWLIRVF